jgi:histidine ammonia-lyase
MENIGLNSGLMIPQYTSAALVTENKTLCFPASADSIPTSLGQEDHVSMGSISGRKLHQVLDNLEYILAVELLSAVQAFEFRRPLKTSPILEAVIESVQQVVSYAKEDRIFSIDLEKLRDFIRCGQLEKVTRDYSTENGIDLTENHPDFQL